jgi:predicted lipoprotein with Yx(FWY)xxD motif
MAVSRNRDCALAAKTTGRTNAIVALDVFHQRRSTMQTNRGSNSLSGGTPRLALVATAAALAAVAALVFLLLHPMGGDAAASSGPSVSTASTSLGRIVVNSGGRTLYMFSKDKNDKSASAGMCAKFWPAGTKVERQAKAKPKPVQSGIPQNNGGDHDSDNNGGPSDGDGNI